MKRFAAPLLVLAFVGLFLAGCEEGASVRPVFDALEPGMTETQVERVVGFPDSRERDSWIWLDLEIKHEEVSITWGRDGRVIDVLLVDSTPGGKVKKRKPPARPANTPKPAAAVEPVEPTEQSDTTGAPAQAAKACRPSCPTRTATCATNGCSCPSGCLI